MQALHVSSFLEVPRNFLPIARPVFLHQSPQLVILLRRPPTLLECTALLPALALEEGNLFEHVVKYVFVVVTVVRIGVGGWLFLAEVSDGGFFVGVGEGVEVLGGGDERIVVEGVMVCELLVVGGDATLFGQLMQLFGGGERLGRDDFAIHCPN